jgi:hypothetical protein
MRPRAHRTELEAAVAKCVIDAVKETNPGLRDTIRAALDRGAVKPADIRKRYGMPAARGRHYSQTAQNMALTIEWLVDEWERDKGLLTPNESIDRVQ